MQGAIIVKEVAYDRALVLAVRMLRLRIVPARCNGCGQRTEA